MVNLSRLHKPVGSVCLALFLAGCSGSVEDALDDVLPKREPLYKSSSSLPPLEVPPDLTSSTIQETLQVPAEGTTTYSAYANQGNTGGAAQVSAVLPQIDRVRVERSDDERWLVVEASPSEVWPKIRDFWIEQGFLVKVEDPSIGIMETDWAEKRAEFKPGLIKGLLSKLSSALYGAAVRDKFRTRLERGTGPGETEVYISHRGAEEVSTGDRTPAAQQDGTDGKVWQPRPSDPELEAEMLNRMMLHFGVSEKRATTLLADTKARKPRAQLVRERTGAAVLALDENFSRAWRRTGLALDRVGFTVEDRDRSRGLFYVRYIDPELDVSGEDTGFFSKLKFWGSDEQKKPDAYLISLVGGQNTTQVVVLNKEGERESGATANRILGLLHQQLK